MTADVTVMTAQDLLRMPDDGMRHELVNGELITMAPAGEEHGDLSMAIGSVLRQYVRERGLGKVYSADTGFVLTHDPDTVRAPDASFVRAERVRRRKDFIDGAPDLAIEVISPSDTYSEVDEKVREYLGAGTEMVIVVDPRKRTATVHMRAGSTQHLSIDDSLDGGEVVPGWRLPLREIFESE